MDRSSSRTARALAGPFTAGALLFVAGLAGACGPESGTGPGNRPGDGLSGDPGAARDTSFAGSRAPIDPAAVDAYERGKSATAGGRRLEAVSEFTRAIALAPDWAEPQRSRADVANQAGDLATALESYAWLMEAEPEVADHAVSLVYVCLRLGDLEMAHDGLERLAVLEPGRARLHLARACVAFEGGLMDLAEREARKAVSKDGAMAEAHYILGVAAEERGDQAAALAAWERALAADPGQLGARDLYATLLLRMGREAEAELQRELHGRVARVYASDFDKLDAATRARHLEALAAEVPGWAHAMRELGRAWGELGRDEEAVQVLRASIELENTAEVHRLMYESLTRLGKLKAAERHGQLAGVLPVDDAALRSAPRAPANPDRRP